MNRKDETIDPVQDVFKPTRQSGSTRRQMSKMFPWRRRDDDDDDDPPPCPAVIAPMPRLPRFGAEATLEAA